MDIIFISEPSYSLQYGESRRCSYGIGIFYDGRKNEKSFFIIELERAQARCVTPKTMRVLLGGRQTNDDSKYFWNAENKNTTNLKVLGLIKRFTAQLD